MPRDLIAHPETKPLDAVGRVFEEAINVLARQGWKRWCPHDRQSAQCLLGAVSIAADMPWPIGIIPYSDVSQRFAARLGFRHDFEAFSWNDEEGRTAQEVVARLRAAARGEL